MSILGAATGQCLVFPPKLIFDKTYTKADIKVFWSCQDFLVFLTFGKIYWD